MSGRLAKRPEIIYLMAEHTKLLDVAGSSSLTFNCGELPADDAITAAGHEPNGYFWEGMVRYLARDLAEGIELDSEAGMFAAHGDRSTLEQLQLLIDPYLEDGARVAATIRQAEESGFQFDD
jgi:hypothetical protein